MSLFGGWLRFLLFIKTNKLACWVGGWCHWEVLKWTIFFKHFMVLKRGEWNHLHS
jgi:hypothetical protein